MQINGSVARESTQHDLDQLDQQHIGQPFTNHIRDVGRGYHEYRELQAEARLGNSKPEIGPELKARS